MNSSQTGTKSYYLVLGLGSDASSLSIRNAYRKLAMKWHPDKCRREDQVGAKLKFQEIQEAYAVLSDDRKKLLYDNGLLHPEDDEEDIEGLSCFLNEMTGMMDEMHAAEKNGKGPSFEELQQLFVDTFSSDLKAAPLNSSPSFRLSSSARQPDNKRSWQSQGFASFDNNIGTSISADIHSLPQSHVYFRDFFDYGSFVTSNRKRQKSTSLESTSSTRAVQHDHTWQVDASVQEQYVCRCRGGILCIGHLVSMKV